MKIKSAACSIPLCALLLSACGGGGGGGAGNDGGSTDTTAPTVDSTSPAAHATDVAINTIVSITFSEAVDCATITTSSFTLKDAGSQAVSGAVACSGSSASFTPAASLASNTTHTATVTTAARDSAGNALAADHIWSFMTGATFDTTAPTVSSVSPMANASAVSVGTTVSVTFSETMDCTTVSTSSFTLKDAGNNAIGGAIACSGSTATFTPAAALAYNTAHTATVTTAARDSTGNALAADYAWSFTTGGASDTTAPTVSSVSPTANAGAVAISTAVSVIFSEAMDCATITADSFALKDAGNNAIGGTVACSGSSATFTPAADLAYATTHTATVTTLAKDSAGNALAADHAWSFTTGAAPDTTAPTVSTTTPLNGATGVNLDATASATFSEALNCTTLTASSFTLKDATDNAVSGDVTCSGSTATLTPTAALEEETDYTATLTTAIQDGAANALAAAYPWSFTTRIRAWGTAGLLPNPDYPSSNADQLRVAAGADGSAFAVWKDQSTNNVLASRYTRTGGWEDAIRLHAGANFGAEPQVAVDATGNALVVYVAGDALNPRIWSRRYNAATGVWSVATNLQSTTNYAVAPQIAVDASGNGFAVWTESDGVIDYHIYANRYSAAAGSWQGAGPLESSDVAADTPRIAVDAAGNAYAVWVQGAMIARVFDAATATWESTNAVNSIRAAGIPAIAAGADGEAFVLWAANDGTNSYAYASRYSGGSWGIPQRVSDGVAYVQDDPPPALAVDTNGNAFATWNQLNVTWDAVANHYLTGSGWQSAHTLQADNGSRNYAIGVDAHGNAMALWEKSSGGIAASRYRGTAWAASTTIDTGVAGSVPQIAFDPRGDAVAVWTHFISGSFAVGANRFE